MKIFCQIIAILVFIVHYVHGSENQISLQKEETKSLFSSLHEESMDWIRKNLRKTNYIADIKVSSSMKALDLLTELKSADDLFLILVFYSYGTATTLPFSVGKIFELANQQNVQGTLMFDKIKDNYKKLLYQKLIEENDQEAVTQAMEVYLMKFRPIWRKLVKSDMWTLITWMKRFFIFKQ
jgi:hypothetical protein